MRPSASSAGRALRPPPPPVVPIEQHDIPVALVQREREEPARDTEHQRRAEERPAPPLRAGPLLPALGSVLFASVAPSTPSFWLMVCVG